MARFDNKVVIVTGGNSGIGKAASLQFAREGARVVVSARREAKGEAVVDEIKSTGGEAMFVKCDVANADEVKHLVEQTATTYGGLDYAFNNAGMVGPNFALIENYSDAEWQRVMDVNINGVFYCMKYQIPEMLRRGGGAIVNMASVSGLKGSRGGAASYATSKHAVIGLTKSAALENAQRNIRVNAVCPAVIDTPMAQEYLFTSDEVIQRLKDAHPVGRFGKPEEVATAVCWLCSDEASFITGEQMLIDGGLLA